MAIALPLSTENRTDSNYGSTVFLTNNTDIKKESPTMRDIRSRDENTSSTVTMSSASTKTKSSILRNASTEENHKRRPLKVSFAKMKTVHIVDNLRLCLTREEKSMLWYTSDSSFRQSPTELRLAAAFTHSNRSRNTITKKDDEEEARGTEATTTTEAATTVEAKATKSAGMFSRPISNKR
eukprot:CAMPEP_0201136190 /NCGR_PEP_ID=MMETSP0850-20130426/54752_1 /ASSEMBLY_ACC=CAM_ASM_000622 /TAXON_ID=183588 /ORGANISM="Pseudo-nitzschia fraudulenta, Strain WWA7" /LENGTH=180 /DNA_ID=CAMNT_0047407477 /DNA_START=61 /DNA_END=604 /DNA_ORIENTATION=+